jgi:zinc transporter
METTETTYGSDQHGLVWAYRFEPGEPPAAINSDDATNFLQAGGTRESAFVWIHLSLANAASERWVRRCLTLPEAFYHSLAEEATATRLEQDGDTLVAVLHDALFDFTFDPESVSTVYLCMTPQFVVTAVSDQSGHSTSCAARYARARLFSRPRSCSLICSCSRRMS